NAFKGTEYYVIGNIKYGVDDTNYLITNHDTMYESYINSDSKVESFTLNFHKEFVLDVFNAFSNSDEFLLDYPEIRDKNPVNFFEKLYPRNEKIILYLNRIKSLINRTEYDYAIINELLHIILDRLFHLQLKTYCDSEKIESKKKSTRLELYRRLNLAKDYVHSNFGRKIGLSDLAKISCLSSHHLLRKFKAVFGITPHQYLTFRRLEQAKYLLINSSKSVTEICLIAGFESLSSFGDLFKKKYLHSPYNFRKVHQKKSIFR
ncbi:MAG: AraC family transcriptional regulator, partial [Chlorobi bacterium]|nr:AraC family transcriptional regulator [Chlorobiota bacterium]